MTIKTPDAQQGSTYSAAITDDCRRRNDQLGTDIPVRRYSVGIRTEPHYRVLGRVHAHR